MIENFKLRVFRVVADTLNFRRAADELHLTQPAITAQIKSLEESLVLHCLTESAATGRGNQSCPVLSAALEDPPPTPGGRRPGR
jgi:predicted transcriptional regulator